MLYLNRFFFGVFFQAISDCQLFAIVAAFLGVDIVILATQQLIDPIRIKTVYTGEKV